MDKKILLVLLVAGTILSAATIPFSAPLPPSIHGAQATPTRNPIAPPLTQWNKTYGGTGF